MKHCVRNDVLRRVLTATSPSGGGLCTTSVADSMSVAVTVDFASFMAHVVENLPIVCSAGILIIATITNRAIIIVQCDEKEGDSLRDPFWR